MEFKGTKGEWEIEDVTTHSGNFYKVKGDISVCNITTRCGGKAIANAKLIAAAPELLEALQTNNKVIKDFIEHAKSDMDEQTFSAFNNVFIRSEKSINKALK